MTISQNDPTQSGSVASTAIVAGLQRDGLTQNHAEGIVVSTGITAGIGGDIPGERRRHAEGIVVSTAITTGDRCPGGTCPSDPTNQGEGILIT